jgi:cold shock CspA family protein
MAIREHIWGLIKILTDRGFGFISVEGVGRDLFFHSNSLKGVMFDELSAGDLVEFDIDEYQEKLIAVNVERNGDPQRQENLEVFISDPNSNPISTEPVEIKTIKAITNEVIQRLSRNPIDLYQLHPKMFEELIAEIFMSEGYKTELIKTWNQVDGGIDIIALRRDIGGFPIRCAIQCKRYASHRLITADPIRSLAGVLDRFQAHVGVIATSSHATKPARAEIEAHFWKINLRDYESIVAALQRLAFLRK